jgi:hypothetical protein
MAHMVPFVQVRYVQVSYNVVSVSVLENVDVLQFVQDVTAHY